MEQNSTQEHECKCLGDKKIKSLENKITSLRHELLELRKELWILRKAVKK